MKIAVTYDNGTVFQHFGRTQFFKIYDVENGTVTNSTVIDNSGLGHEALAGLLADKAIDVLICGGMGPGAQAALSEAGLEVVAGASGDADAAVAAYLKGELVSTGVNCDHHDHEHHEEEQGCGCGEEGGCEGGCCGGGCAGCGPQIEGKNVGKTVRVHYRGTFNDGTQFDSSYDRGEPLEFICGAGMMIFGFDAAVAKMDAGQIIDVHLMPEEAYGPKDPNQVIKLLQAQLPGSEGLEVGERVYLEDNMGRQFGVTVVDKTDTEITFDANHEMAGKELNFRIELVEVK